VSDLHLRVKAPEVIHETIDGEVIIINLGTGNYYSVKGTGASVWTILHENPGVTVDQLTAAVASRHATSDDLTAAIEQFVADLLREDLVATDGEQTTMAPASPDSPAEEWQPPVLEKYTDMQDLVLLDPVHEVEPAGWPHAQPAAPAADAPA
jgi:Coenzyme PQQ synthesis protein D (PqqD)